MSQTKDLVANPQAYLDRKSQSLSDRLESIDLSDEEKAAIADKRTLKTARDAALDLTGIFGKVAKTVLDWQENVEKDFKDAKKERLLDNYFALTDDTTRAIDALKAFVTNPFGNVLFSKILRIADDSVPDQNLLAALSKALHHITNTDFVSQFEDHKFALALIEQLTVQSLLILADHRHWPGFHLPSRSTEGNRVTSDWTNEFASPYAQAKGIVDVRYVERVRICLSELRDHSLIEAIMRPDGVAICVLRQTGSFLLQYLS